MTEVVIKKMENKAELLRVSETIENKLKKMTSYILMPIDERKSMVDSMVKIVMRMPNK